MRTSHNISRAMLRLTIPLLRGLVPAYSLHKASQYRPQGCFTLLFKIAMLAYYSSFERIDPWSVSTRAIYTSALGQAILALLSAACFYSVFVFFFYNREKPSKETLPNSPQIKLFCTHSLPVLKQT